MEPAIYLRGSLAEEAECQAAEKHFHTVNNRAALTHEYGKPWLVIPRYSALPYYRELEADMYDMGNELINTYRQHCYVADILEWYADLEDVTPKTWFSLDQVPVEGPFVVKGATNSKKFEWDTHMFAKDRRAAVEVASRLYSDSIVGQQDVVVREYVPLNQLAMGLRGLPISEEYRFFILDGQVVDSGFYWSSHVDDLDQEYKSSAVPTDFLDKVIERVGQSIRFWVVDIARKADGGWMVVELNDGQQSGLSEIDPDNFYKVLRERL